MVITKYEDEMERKLHLDHIENLSRDLNVPLEDLRPLYESVFVNLKAKATITLYLPIFVDRKVRALLQSKSSL